MRLLLPIAFLSLAYNLAGAADHSEADRLFTLKVGPLLSLKCNGCHGDDAEKIKGGFNMLTREGLLEGGEEIGGEVLVPGHAEKSFLMQTIRWDDPDFEMPPKENDRLDEKQIAMVAEWINAGAPWPDEKTQKAIRLEERGREITDDGVLIKSSGGLGDEWTYRRYQPEDVWAFRPVKKPAVPADIHPVDHFVRRQLKERGFSPAPQADPRTLIRRATYDLLGLPPTPKETYDFSQAWKADSEKAWSDLVDRLLASPHYGERWGQHWLDVVRYADTGGYSNDYERSNAWRYRDYVIRSLNGDKPYDQFVKEQLAGDEIDPQNPEMIVATGLLRMGPFDNAMVKAPEARQMYLDDVVNSVGQTFLATTMRCLKCHDHKFDPIPTRDYYRMYATFATTQMAERPAAYLKEENCKGFDENKKEVQRLLDYAVGEKNKLVEKRETAAKAWYKKRGREYVGHAQRKNLPDEEKPPRHVGLDYVDQGQLKVREQDEWIWNRRLERFEPLTQGVYSGPDPKNVYAKKLRMLPETKWNKKWRPNSRIYVGGSLEAPGDEVSPGVLSAVSLPAGDAADGDPYRLPDALVGRRKAFADWVANPGNALTTRSIVNRIWQYHFGKPIAGNPNNFGAKGGKPTHPELLDWLAAELVDGGWKLKRLHKLIMMSGTYRQSGSHPDLEKLRNSDPNNDLFAYLPPRRLTAEEIRDSMLLVSGELNTEMGGLPSRPEINMEVALQPRMIQFSLAPAYQPSPTPEQRNRRTIYSYRVRGQADPFLELFNQPNPNDSCEERDAAAVTPQAFTLLNSDTMADRAIALALRLQREKGSPDEQIAGLFHQAFSRQPSAKERSRLSSYLKEMHAYHAKRDAEKPEYPTEITRSLVEEFTGQPFEYQEILPVFENYTPDKKAADVSAETRALADVCLIIFNSHEFLYIY